MIDTDGEDIGDLAVGAGARDAYLRSPRSRHCCTRSRPI